MYICNLINELTHQNCITILADTSHEITILRNRVRITLDFSVNVETQVDVFLVTDAGLELSICKLIIHKWKREIWINSDYIDGARFVFSHPLNLNIERE